MHACWNVVYSSMVNYWFPVCGWLPIGNRDVFLVRIYTDFEWHSSRHTCICSIHRSSNSSCHAHTCIQYVVVHAERLHCSCIKQHIRRQQDKWCDYNIEILHASTVSEYSACTAIYVHESVLLLIVLQHTPLHYSAWVGQELSAVLASNI